MSEYERNTHDTAGRAGQPASPYRDYYGRQRPLGHPARPAPHAGHKAGAETFRRIATYCKDIGVKYLTVYAFSTENWKRSEDGGLHHHGRF